MPRRSYAYTITVEQVGPAFDPDYLRSSASVKAEVKRWIIVYGLKEKDADLAAGLDVKGQPLAPLSLETIRHRDSDMGPADPYAPPLMPAYATSRTRLLLTGEATTSGAQFFWEYDPLTGGSWGRILDAHRRGRYGRGRGKRRRNVIGISPDAIRRVRNQVMARWQTWKLSNLAGPSPRRLLPIEAPPPRLRVVGRTDYQSFTFGIGDATGAPGRNVQTTGAFRLERGQGSAAIGGPEGTVLTALADALRLAPRPGYTTVRVDVAAVERSLSTTIGSPGLEMTRRVADAVESGKAIDQPIVRLDDDGGLLITAARALWAWLRDQGSTSVDVSVPRSQAARIRARYGA